MSSAAAAAPAERPFWNPYIAGVFLGLVLLASFLVMGFGLGSSSAVTRVAVAGAHLVAPKTIEANGYFSQYVGPGKQPLMDWMVFEVLGVLLGGLLGAYSAGRLRIGVEKGAGVTNAKRFAMAVVGGILMGYAARLARGCTSGQALTGGAALSLGSWVFMMAVFTSGATRREWR